MYQNNGVVKCNMIFTLYSAEDLMRAYYYADSHPDHTVVLHDYRRPVANRRILLPLPL